MDFTGRDQTWLTQIEYIFKTTTRCGELKCGQTKESKENIKILLHKRMHLWWNTATLENDLAKGLIPRGLRVQVFPSFPTEDQIFRTKWEDACSGCSHTMMELLIGLNKKDLDVLEREIDEAKNKLTELLTPN